MTSEIAQPRKRGRTSYDRSAYDWFDTFESTLRLTGNVTAACERAGVSRTAAYNARGIRADLLERWDYAQEYAISQLELEARRRAFDGSDTMLIFLLKKQKPELYGDHVRLEHSGAVDNAVVFTIIPNNPVNELTD